jgi:hypothetical protein
MACLTNDDLWYEYYNLGMKKSDYCIAPYTSGTYCNTKKKVIFSDGQHGIVEAVDRTGCGIKEIPNPIGDGTDRRFAISISDANSNDKQAEECHSVGMVYCNTGWFGSSNFCIARNDTLNDDQQCGTCSAKPCHFD